MTADELDCEDFLDIVYGEKKGWIDLPARVGEYWVPFYTEWPDDSGVTRRIDSSIRDEEDLYYSVAQFSERGRRIEDVLPAAWLWADLDEVHPTEAAKLGFLPTIAVESSPSRYQALWRLTRELKPKSLVRLNRGLTYALGADRGGYDLTQVLRLPGTRNFKYPDAPKVELMWYRPDVAYEPREIWAAVKEHVGDAELTAALSVKLPKRPISRKAEQLLRTPIDQVVEGERSAKLWELECLLAEAGLSEDEIYDLVYPTPWNKWRSVSAGASRLKRDITKAMNHVRQNEVRKKRSPTPEEVAEKAQEKVVNVGAGLPFIGYSSFMAMKMPEAKWLIKDIWTASSHGIIGGEPKTSKTTLALALALSVASGKPFLGQYPAGVTGPVLMVQEENPPWMMQDRLRKLANYYGLLGRDVVHRKRAGAGSMGRYSLELDFPEDIPLKILNNYGFDLAVEEHREMLVAEIEEIRPKLLILDPLYLVLGGADENKSAELRPFLKWLLQLRYEYDLAVIVVHHMRKQQQNGGVVRAGQRLLGSATLHGWIDSALYCSAVDDEREKWIGVMVEREFRSMAPQRPLSLGLTLGDPGSLSMEVELAGYDLGGEIRKMVHAQPGVALRELADAFGMDRRVLEGRLAGLGLEIKKGGRGRGNTSTVWPAV